MGASGPRALVKNGKVFLIALFACLGGVLYGYNQGMFSGILAMPSFGARMFTSLANGLVVTVSQKRTDTLTTRRRRDGSLLSWNLVHGSALSCLAFSQKSRLVNMAF